jgi:CubicO group peptidase (beta-lactamase class C family)
MSDDIRGTVVPGFEPVRAAFAANFARPGDYQEVGAALAAYHRGRCVVNLWGGYANRARTKAWKEDTLINVWSATKGAVAVAMAMLVERSRIRYEDAVASVWPEFAHAGKAEITIAQVLSHQAGLPGFAEPTSIEDQYDWDKCCAKLARQQPAWPPGTATSYHAMTYGWLAGEIVRRVTGDTIGAFIANEIARPLHADIFVGLPEAEEPRVAEIIAPKGAPQMPPLSETAMLALTNPQQNAEQPNARAWRAAEIPAANGQASAIGLARVYAALLNGGELAGRRILPPESVARMTAPATRDGRIDMFLGFKDGWGMGMALNTPGIYGTNPRAFGHSGWGGAFGCADPDAAVAVGYVCNQMGPELVGDPRTAGLCAAVFECCAANA